MWTFELDWTSKIMDSMIPPGVEEQIPQAATEAGAVEVLREMILYTPAITAVGFRAAIWFIEVLGPMIAMGKFSRFSKLDPPSREKVLETIYKSKVYLMRQLVLLIKMAACFAWGAYPQVREGLGAAGEPKFVKRNVSLR